MNQAWVKFAIAAAKQVPPVFAIQLIVQGSEKVELFTNVGKQRCSLDTVGVRTSSHFGDQSPCNNLQEGY